MPTEDIFAEYHKWKQQGASLRAAVKQTMEARFADLLTQAAKIAEEYRADFGVPLKPPSSVTSFRYKAGGKSKPKKPRAAKPAEVLPPKPVGKPNPRVAVLQKRLETARKKLETAKAAGSPTRNLEDRIYEIEDELRLAVQAG